MSTVTLSRCNRLNGAAVLPAAMLAAIARDALADARRLINTAMVLRNVAQIAIDPESLHQRAARRLSEARAIIASARKLYAHAMARLAKLGMLRHRYGRHPNAYRGERWLAVVSVADTGPDHVLPRTYGKRQSAQRAALAHVRKLATAAACAGVMA